MNRDSEVTLPIGNQAPLGPVKVALIISALFLGACGASKPESREIRVNTEYRVFQVDAYTCIKSRYSDASLWCERTPAKDGSK